MMPLISFHDLQYSFLLLFPIITFFFFFFFKPRPNKSLSKLPPPSPPTLPLIGNLHQLGSLPHRTLRALSNKYGPLMLVHFGCRPTIIVSSAEVAKEVMKTHDLVFASRPPSSIAKRLMYNSHDVAFAPYGEYWRQVRRISVLHLLSAKRVQSFRTVREEEVSLLLDKIHQASSSNVNMSEIIMILTNNITCRVALGRRYFGEEGGGNRELSEMIAEFYLLLGSLPVRDFIPWLGWIDLVSGLDARVRRHFNKMDAFLERVLEDHLGGAKGSDGRRDCKDCNNSFVDILLSLGNNLDRKIDKDDSNSISLSRDHVKALVLDMFGAGTETSFTVLEWTMTELIRNPEVMRKAQDEVRGIVGSKEKVTDEEIDRMNYLKAVIKESLRLHPPGPLLIPRQAVEDILLQGYDIPAGTRVMINAWAIGRDPKSWERAEEFWPERFMNSSIDFKGQDFQFIPFGAGRRSCPGVLFAITTIELTLAHLLHRFDWELPDAMIKGEELDMSESQGITAHRKSALVVAAKSRLP